MEQSSVQIPPINEISMEEKKAALLKRKKRFESWFIFVKIFMVGLLFYPLGRYIYMTYIYSPPPTMPETTIIKPKPPSEPPITQKAFTNQELMLALFYPSNSEITSVEKNASGSIIKTTILYSGDKKTGDPDLTQQDIKNGYYIKITRFITQQANIESILTSKMEGLRQKCLESSNFTVAEKTTLDSVEGKRFSITNCEGNWRVTYIPRFYSYYEIEQFMRGDFGYIEKYSNETDDIVKTIKFYADEPPAYGEFETFYDKENKYSLDHRHYNSVCCAVPEPPTGSFQKRIVLADPSSIIDAQNFDGFGVFIIDSGNFDELVGLHKRTLRDEYVVINGIEPTTQEKTLEIGGNQAVWLKGYSWKGNDLIYINQVKDNGFVMILSIENKSGVAFEKKLEEIFSRMKFNIKIEE